MELTVNTEDRDENALWVASKHGLVDEVHSLLAKGGENIEITSSNGSTPLIVSSIGGHVNVVELLLDAGAHINQTYVDKFTPLYLAARNGHLEVVRLLLDNGANVDQADINQRTPLFIAASRNHQEIVTLLVARGASVDLAEYRGFTPLCVAAERGYVEIATTLIDSGALFDSPGIKQVTPLHIATTNGQLEMMKLLLDRGARVDLPARNDVTALHIAAKTGYTDVLRLLVERGANVNLKTNFEATALHIAMQFLHWEAFMVLLDAGAILDRGLARIALKRSLLDGWFAIAEILINRSPQFDIIGTNEEPIHMVVACNEPQSRSLLNLLIQKDVDLDATWFEIKPDGTLSSQTALHIAILQRNNYKIWQLVLHGADPTIPYVSGTEILPITQTVWDLCSDNATRAAVLHFWTPKTHKRHPQWVKNGIISTMLVAKRNKWPFDQLLLHKILSFVAYGWYKPPKYVT